jgi:hypothetical protein
MFNKILMSSVAFAMSIMVSNVQAMELPDSKEGANPSKGPVVESRISTVSTVTAEDEWFKRRAAEREENARLFALYNSPEEVAKREKTRREMDLTGSRCDPETGYYCGN